MRTIGPSTDPSWQRYETLNFAITQEVFAEDQAGQPVYLDLEPDVLARIAKRLEPGPATDPDEQLVDIVKATLQSPERTAGMFSAHTAEAFRWELEGSSSPPPCIAVLAVLSLVAERMKRTDEFAASNYYGRLLQTLAIDEKFQPKVERDFRRETPYLWNTLNRWLEDCDGRRGLPTAVAFDHRRYIGLPLSQALVRAHDRTKLPSLFAQFGLQPGQRISVQAMQQLLEEWLPHSQVTQSLKRLWSKQATKERIAEVVCAEVEGWDGAVPSDVRPAEHERDDNLFLAAELRAHPHPAIDLLLVARLSGQERSRTLALPSDASDATRSALGRLGDDMRLQPIPGTSWESLEPSHLVSCPELLIANVSLSSPDGGGNCSRRAKRLILLKRHEADHLYVEARRAELLETYLVLVVPELAGSVREALRPAARAGLQEATHETLRGLPADWIAFQNVQLERIPGIPHDDLRPLQPIARTHLALGGGLPLPGMNVWHGDRLPELRVVVDEHSESNVAHIRAVPIRYMDQRETADVPLAEIEGAGIVDLSKTPALRDGDFRIVVTSATKSRVLATAGLRTRSGSWPRRVEEGEDTRIGHTLLDQHGLTPFAGSLGELGAGAASLSGAVVDNEMGPVTIGRADAPPPIPNRPGVLVEDVEKDLLEPLESTGESALDDLPICFKRAHHHWLCAEQHAKEPVYMVCKDCGREKWWEPKRHRRSKRRTTQRLKRDDAEMVSRHRPLPTISRRDRADMELVLDALSYARTGSWRSLRAITTPIDDAPWFAHEAARRLQALGHIELEIDATSLLPKRWAIAPPTIVQPESGPCFLAGSRSARLIDAVAEVSSILEGELRKVPQADGPNVVEIHGLEGEGLALLVDEIRQQRRLPLELSTRPASRIAPLLPSLGKIRGLLPDLTITAPRLERLDLSSGRWSSTDQMDRPGAYRLRSRPWVYAVVPKPGVGAGRRVVADVRLAKHFAASDASFALIGYDEPSRTLLASLGAPLPGLLERAAVLCSGRLPILRPDGTLAYEGVPLDIAESIWAAATLSH